MNRIILAIIGMLLAAVARVLAAGSACLKGLRPAWTAATRSQHKALAIMWQVWSANVQGIPSLQRIRRALVAPAQSYSAP